MVEYRIKNGAPVDKAFKVRGGHQIVASGKEAIVVTTRPLIDEVLAALAADGVKVSEAKASAEKPAPASLEARHVGGGAWFIMDGDKRVGEAMKKGDAEAFNTLSDEEKAAFISQA